MSNTPSLFLAKTNLVLAFKTITSTTYSPTGSDYTILVDATSNAVTINLPLAGDNRGRIYVIKAIDITNTVTIDPAGSELIDTLSTLVLASQGDSETIQSNGVGWMRL